jgi:choice-of-anchor C domain-containing protein
MRKLLVIALLVTLVTFVPAAFGDATTNIVTNGTFSTNYDAGGATHLGYGSTSLPGWTVGGEGGVDLIGSYWQAPPSGGNSVDLSGNGAGSTSQVLDTSPTGSYWNISFYLSGNPDAAGVKSVQVTFGSNSWIFSVDSTGNTHENMNWQLITINNILINSTPTTLTFTSLTPSAWGPVIAGISVVDPPPADPITTPEPGSMLLMGSGLIGLAGLARKRL